MSDNIRKALDAYAATETDAFINAFHFVDGGVWQDIEEEADRCNRQDVAPAPFAALRAVLDLHESIDVHHVDIEEGGNEVVTDRLSHQVCKHCSDEDYVAGLEFGDIVGLDDGVRHPCATVKAIAAALGVES